MSFKLGTARIFSKKWCSIQPLRSCFFGVRRQHHHRGRLGIWARNPQVWFLGVESETAKFTPDFEEKVGLSKKIIDTML